MSEPYLLSPHVHICVAADHVVLLDLVRDKYVSVGPSMLAGRVKGWPQLGPAASAASPETGAGRVDKEEALITRLLSSGVLVTDPALGKEAVLTQAAKVETLLLAPEFGERPRAASAHFWPLAWAYARARWALKVRSLQRLVKAVAQRKRRALAKRPAVQGTPEALEAARQLVAAFVQLRPLLYRARGACMLDSLVLLTFLADHGLFPQWVLGVQMDPFYAHCWVQQDSVLFNDNPDFVRCFTPILVV